MPLLAAERKAWNFRQDYNSFKIQLENWGPHGEGFEYVLYYNDRIIAGAGGFPDVRAALEAAEAEIARYPYERA